MGTTKKKEEGAMHVHNSELSSEKSTSFLNLADDSNELSQNSAPSGGKSPT